MASPDTPNENSRQTPREEQTAETDVVSTNAYLGNAYLQRVTDQIYEMLEFAGQRGISIPENLGRDIAILLSDPEIRPPKKSEWWRFWS
jgi:hypothetical protein